MEAKELAITWTACRKAAIGTTQKRHVEWAFFALLMLLDKERIRSPLALSAPRAPNSHLGFECLSGRHGARELSLRAHAHLK